MGKVVSNRSQVKPWRYQAVLSLLKHGVIDFSFLLSGIMLFAVLEHFVRSIHYVFGVFLFSFMVFLFILHRDELLPRIISLLVLSIGISSTLTAALWIMKFESLEMTGLLVFSGICLAQTLGLVFCFGVKKNGNGL